jgi:hypothetical protein
MTTFDKSAQDAPRLYREAFNKSFSDMAKPAISICKMLNDLGKDKLLVQFSATEECFEVEISIKVTQMKKENILKRIIKKAGGK